MADQGNIKRIFLSSCEASGDAHCANLIKSLERTVSEEAGKEEGGIDKIEFVGVGGQKMAEAGCELLEDTVRHAAMIYNAFGQVGYYYKLIRRIRGYLKANKVDLVVVCDSPAFNFHVAKAARKAKVEVLWYIAPQLWAWGAWRARKLRKRCTKLACILPFEKEWFRSRGLEVSFVGNPIFDELSIDINSSYKEYADFNPRSAKVVLIPGSRKAEINTLWRPMQRISLRLRQRWPGIKFIAVAVDDEGIEVLKEKQLEEFRCEYTTEPVEKVAHESHMALAASGSATLQVAAAGCPMVVMYQSSRIMWKVAGQWLIKTRFLSLVNILARKEIVKEFMPYFNSIEPIFGKCSALLNNTNKLKNLSRELVNLVEPLARGKASDKVARLALEMMQE